MPTFEERLLAEVDRLTETDWATEARCPAAGGDRRRWPRPPRPEEVAEVVVVEGVAVLGASGGCVLTSRDDGPLAVFGAQGYEPDCSPTSADGSQTCPSSVSPSAVWVESRQERDERFPHLARSSHVPARCASYRSRPAGGRWVLCGSALTTRGCSTRNERRFVQSLAAQTAQALDRSLLLVAERDARSKAEALAERLARLQRVTAELDVRHRHRPGRGDHRQQHRRGVGRHRGHPVPGDRPRHPAPGPPVRRGRQRRHPAQLPDRAWHGDHRRRPHPAGRRGPRRRCAGRSLSRDRRRGSAPGRPWSWSPCARAARPSARSG